MGRWLKLSLRYRFILALVAFTVVLSVSFGFIAANRMRQELEEQVKQRGYQISSNVATTLSTQLFPGADIQPMNPAQRQQTLNVTLQLYQAFFTPTGLGSDVLYIQVVDEGQAAIIPPVRDLEQYLDLQPVQMKYTQELDRRALPTGLPDQYKAGTPYFDLKVAITPPTSRIIWEPGRPEPLRTEIVPPSYVRVGLSLAYVEQVVRREWLQIAVLSALYIFLGLLISFWLYKSILGPIETLTKAVKRFKREKNVRAQVHSGDELETLAEEFNRMADTIAEHDTRLERINQELRRANRVKSEFLAVMGHELKTPLHAIKGYSQLLLEGVDGPTTPNQREDLASILAASDHLHELIDNILRFSKIESGAEELHLEELSAAEVIAEAVQSVRSLSREKGIVIETAANGLHLRADETKLKQILINLLGNAIKYSQGGTVRVSAEQDGDGVRFSVQDTGIGIAPEYRETIFEPFTQIDSSNTREWAGIGLGLAIVKKYVEMHSGRVWVESELGHGSVFTFTLPHALLPAATHEEVPALESADR